MTTLKISFTEACVILEEAGLSPYSMAENLPQVVGCDKCSVSGSWVTLIWGD